MTIPRFTRIARTRSSSPCVHVINKHHVCVIIIKYVCIAVMVAYRHWYKRICKARRNFPTISCITYKNRGIFIIIISTWIRSHNHPIIPSIPTILEIKNILMNCLSRTIICRCCLISCIIFHWRRINIK